VTTFAGPLGHLSPENSAGSEFRHRNANLIQAAALRHIPRGALVADVTYGGGQFWNFRQPGPTWFRLIASDIAPGRGLVRGDFRQLPYAGRTFDAVVFDPPYLVDNSGGLSISGLSMSARYGLGNLPRMDFAAVLGLYRRGMHEASRVLKPGGVLMVKGQDQVHRGWMMPFHEAIACVAAALGLRHADEFGMHGGGRPSFLLVFDRARPYGGAMISLDELLHFEVAGPVAPVMTEIVDPLALPLDPMSQP
jgi:hypothetical protein